MPRCAIFRFDYVQFNGSDNKSSYELVHCSRHIRISVRNHDFIHNITTLLLIIDIMQA